MQQRHIHHLLIAAIIVLAILSLNVTHPLLSGLLIVSVLIYSYRYPIHGLSLIAIYFVFRPFILTLNPSLKIVGDLMIITILAKVLITERSFKKMFKLQLFEWAFLLFCLVGSISALLTGVSLVAIAFQLRAFLITYIVYYVFKRLPIKKSDIKNFLWLVVAMTLFICIQGLVEKLSLRTLFLPEVWKYTYVSPTNIHRIYGVLNNPNVLAVFLALSFVSTLFLKTIVSSVRQKYMLNVVLMLATSVFLLTYSRGAFIATFLGFGIYIVLTKKFALIKSVALPLVLGIVVIYLPVVSNEGLLFQELTEKEQVIDDIDNVSSEQQERIAKTFDEDTIELSKTGGRLYVVYKGLEIFQDNPIIGTGFGTFGDSATKSYSSPIYEKYHVKPNLYSDNQYIQVIVETGIVGTILFAVFLLSMVYSLWKQRKEQTLAIVMLSILVGSFFAGLVYNIWEMKVFTLFFFFGLAIVHHNNQKVLKT